jgi:hypothetical protein
MRKVITLAAGATDRECGHTLKELWKECNIWHAVKNNGDSWVEIKDYTMHGYWNRTAQIWLDFKVLRRVLKMPQSKFFIL